MNRFHAAASAVDLGGVSRSSAIRTGLVTVTRGLFRRPLQGAVALITGLINGATMVLGAQALGWATDAFVLPSLTGGEFLTGAARTAAGAVIGVSLLRASTIIVRGVATGRIQFSQIAADRRALTRRYQRLGPDWRRQHPTGQLLSNTVNDVDTKWQPMTLFPFAIGNVFMLGYSLVSIAQDSVWLALITFCLVPALIGTNLWYQVVASPRYRAASRAKAQVSMVANEAFEGDQVIRTLGVLPRETQRFTDSVNVLRDANIRVGRVTSVFNPVIELGPSLAVIAVLLVGVLLVDQGAIPIGTVVTVSYLLLTMSIPLNIIGSFLGLLPAGAVGTERVSAVLDADAPVSGTTELPNGAVAVQASGITVRRDEQTILDGIDLGIEPGEIVAVLGSTGAGKSTLLRIVARLAEQDDGELRLGGVVGSDVADEHRRRAIAVVPQTSFLFHDTVRENLVLGRRHPDDTPIDDAELWDALGVAVAAEFVAALPDGLETVLGARGASLSGGQRQRLAIARALVGDPSLLVLDDATSALDPTVEARLLAGLHRHLKESADAGRAVTVLLAANRRPSIALADRIVLLDRGRAVAAGPAATLRSDKRVVALVDAYDWNAEELA